MLEKVNHSFELFHITIANVFWRAIRPKPVRIHPVLIHDDDNDRRFQFIAAPRSVPIFCIVSATAIGSICLLADSGPFNGWSICAFVCIIDD